MKYLTTSRPGTAAAVSLGLLLLAPALGDSAFAQTKKKKTEKRHLGLPRILLSLKRAGGPPTTSSEPAGDSKPGVRGGNDSSGGRLWPFDLFRPPPAETTGTDPQGGGTPQPGSGADYIYPTPIEIPPLEGDVDFEFILPTDDSEFPPPTGIRGGLLPRILKPFGRAGGPSTTATGSEPIASGGNDEGHYDDGPLSEIPLRDDSDFTFSLPDIPFEDSPSIDPSGDPGAIEDLQDRFVPDDRPETGYYFPTGRAFQRAVLTPRSEEFEAPGPADLFGASNDATSIQTGYVPADDLNDLAPASTFSHLDDSFFNPGETQFNIGIGGALGNLSEINRIQTPVSGTREVEKTVTRQVQTGKRQVQRRNPNLAETQRQIREVTQKLANATNPNQANRLLQKQGQLFRQANRQIANPQTKTVPVVQNRQFTTREQEAFEDFIEQLEREGIFDKNSPKLALGVTHFLDNHVGIGGQAEWIQGNLDDAFLGLAELTYRVPMEFDNVAVAPYLVGGVGWITGGGIDEVVGAVGGGIEFRPQGDVGIFTGYSHHFLGNGMDFGQIVAGLNIVIGESPLDDLRTLEVDPTDDLIDAEWIHRADGYNPDDLTGAEVTDSYPGSQD